MTRQLILRPTSVNRRQPLLSGPNSTSYASVGGSARFAEVAGGTLAECTAVCCCCPCGIVNLLVLAVYKVPAGLCRKALRKKRRRRLMKKGLLPQPQRSHQCGCDDFDFHIKPLDAGDSPLPGSDDQDVLALEKEMWDKFYATGFWRSPSQRDT